MTMTSTTSGIIGFALEDYIKDFKKGYNNPLNLRDCYSPCLEYHKLEGERNQTPMYDQGCSRKVIHLCIGKSKLAGELAEKALDIATRFWVGDERLDAERMANAATAPKEVKEFVLGSEEAERQAMRQDVRLWDREVSVLKRFYEERDNEWRVAMLSRDVEIKASVLGLNERWSQVMADVQATCASLPFRLGEKINNVIMAAVMNPSSHLVKSLRLAIKRPAIRSTHSARQFPANQKATQVEILGLLIPSFTAAHIAFPEITYDVWKSLRGGFGKAIKEERQRRHALGEGAEGYIDRPLLWSFVGEGTAEGGGQRYVYLREHEAMLREVWISPRSFGQGSRRRVESFDAKARRLAEARARPGYTPEQWPLLSAEMEPDF
jgi:hypothetical protein